MLIREDNLESEAVRNLLREHRDFMAGQSPPESDHSLDLEALRAPDVTVWTAWEGSELLGCGALQELDPRHGEIKSMRTASSHLREGVASALLHHIIAEARQRNFRRLSLETGSMAAFEAARAFYLRFGFEYCGPFADYVEDPHSVFMTRRI